MRFLELLVADIHPIGRWLLIVTAMVMVSGLLTHLFELIKVLARGYKINEDTIFRK